MVGHWYLLIGDYSKGKYYTKIRIKIFYWCLFIVAINIIKMSQWDNLRGNFCLKVNFKYFSIDFVSKVLQ